MDARCLRSRAEQAEHSKIGPHAGLLDAQGALWTRTLSHNPKTAPRAAIPTRSGVAGVARCEAPESAVGGSGRDEGFAWVATQGSLVTAPSGTSSQIHHRFDGVVSVCYSAPVR